jgi:hypothetical protein
MSHTAMPGLGAGGPWPWVALVALGAFHGLNPAMGWLFAVGIGLQERRVSAVLRAIPPIAAGHAASVAAVVVMLALAGDVVPARTLRIAAAVILMVFAAVLVARRFKHPVRVGMRVGWRDLAIWSWLMATAHGAGLMMVPVLLALSARSGASAHGVVAADGLALAVHTAALLAVMTAVAVAVYRVFGVGLLRRAWINLDYLWAGALVAAGVVTLAV